MLADDIAPVLPTFAAHRGSSGEAYPAKSVAALFEAGAITAPFAPQNGGRAAPVVEMVDAVEAIARVCPSTALLVSMPMGLASALVAGLVVAPAEHRRAAEAQLERIAADYGAHKVYAACNSERGAGGSLAATKTVAKKDREGFLLRGEKILGSFGDHADVFFSTAKVDPAELPGAGLVEFFLVDTKAPGVTVLHDWNGFGMRATESHSVRYQDAPAREWVGFPNFIETTKPLQAWFCMFAAIPLGCVAASLHAFGTPSSPVLRSRVADALMRYESARAYLRETARSFRPGASAEFAARVLRTKTWVSQESTRLCAELFSLSGGRHYVRGGAMSGALADSFAGTALRPPLPLALETLAETFSMEALDAAFP